MHFTLQVRDLSSAKVTISPSETTSWADARNELVSEAKAAMRAELETALSAAAGEADIEVLRKDFAKREALIEHEIDSRVHTFSMSMNLTYNVRFAACRLLFGVCETYGCHCLVVCSSSPSKLGVAGTCLCTTPPPFFPFFSPFFSPLFPWLSKVAFARRR